MLAFDRPIFDGGLLLFKRGSALLDQDLFDPIANTFFAQTQKLRRNDFSSFKGNSFTSRGA